LEATLSRLAGDLVGAVESTRSGLEFLDKAGCQIEASPLRRSLAELLLEQDDTEAARIELERVVDVAGRLGMVVERRLAAEELRKLGVTVVEEATAPPAAGGPTGERYVTVLFMDVRGYTALTREVSPAEIADGVATLQRWAAAEVARHQGTIDKFAGDAVMATFNISGAHVDHAQHALACALAIRDKAAALGLPMGAGVATGPAVVGALKEGANVSVIGEATNLASRLQSQAGPGEILLSAETHRRSRDWLSARGQTAQSDRLEVKGFTEPVEAWRLRGS
jgi:class 3 adenylate cyclase